MKVFRRFASVIAVLVFGCLIWLAIYAYQDGFTKKWRKIIVKEFAKHDLNISFEKLTIDPFQGLVANNVVLLERATKEEVARVSKVTLDLDLAKAIRKERFLERIELESARVSLPHSGKEPAGNRLQLQDLNATVVLPPGRVDIARAEAKFYGLHLRLSGSVLHPNQGESQGVFDWQADKMEAAQPILEALVSHLNRLSYESDSAPSLDLSLSGDLTKPQSLRLKGKLEGTNVHYDTFLCHSVEAEATLTRDLLKLENFAVTDGHGRLDVAGDFPLAEDQPAQISVDSTMDLGRLLPMITPDLTVWSWFRLTSAPALFFQGTLQLDQPFTWSAPPVDLVGNLQADGFRVGDEPFEHLSGDFHIQGSTLFARNVRLQHARGESTGKFLSTPEQGVRYSFELGMDPTFLQELPLSAELESFLNRWEFRPNSGITLKLNGERKGQDAATWDHRGEAVLTKCSFATAEIDELSLDFQLNPHAYHFSDIHLQLAPDFENHYSGGTVKAQRISVSARDQLTMLTNLTGFVDPGQVVRCFSPKTADQLDRFRFSRPPEIRIPQGTIDPQGIAQTNLGVEIKSAGTLTTEVLGRPLPLEQPRLGLSFHRENLIVRADHAGLFEGHLTGNVDIRNLTARRDYTANLRLNGVDFGKLAGTYFPERKSDGRFSAQFSWRGQDRDLNAIDGSGRLQLDDSQHLGIPLLSPLSSLINIALTKANLAHDKITRLATQFRMKSSTVELEAMVADLERYRIQGSGEVQLESEEVDLRVSLSPTKKDHRAAVLDVLYEIFGTYRCTGTLEHPKWKMDTTLGQSSLLKAAELLEDLESRLPLDAEKISDARVDLEKLLSADDDDDETEQ